MSAISVDPSAATIPDKGSMLIHPEPVENATASDPPNCPPLAIKLSFKYRLYSPPP